MQKPNARSRLTLSLRIAARGELQALRSQISRAAKGAG